MKIKKPCAKCGGEGHTRAMQTGEDIVETWAQCNGCGARTDSIEDFKSDQFNHECVAHDFALGRLLP